jgi:hypothetical protein
MIIDFTLGLPSGESRVWFPIQSSVMCPDGPQRDEVTVQKTRKRSATSSTPSRHNRHQVVPLPEIVSTDVLGTLLDEDMIVRLRVLSDDCNKAYENRVDARPWETEIAYVRREQQMRRVRRENHSEYVRREQEAFDRIEASLPPGDFDNSAFVYAATGGRPRWN